MPEISVIVPVYNVENVLERCVRSILGQTFTDFELLLIDDGSTDKSSIICDRLSMEDTRIRVFHQENAGVSAARNKGLDFAEGTYIVFIDSDDYVENTFLENSGQDDSDLVVMSYAIEDEIQETTHLKEFYERKYSVNDNLNMLEKDFINGYFSFVWTKRFKRIIIEDNNIRFSEELSLGEDTLFVVKYLSCTRGIIISNKHDYHYVKYNNDNNETLTNKRLSKTFISHIERANDLICEQLKSLFGEKAEKITIERMAAFYRFFLTEINNSGMVDKEFLTYMFKQHWFKKVSSRRDFIPNENWKFRTIIKCQSATLFCKYLLFRRKKKII